MEIQAEFAVRTKKSGDTLDYRILAWSQGILGLPDYERLFTDFGVGTLPVDPEWSGDSPPPWITLGCYAAGEKLFGVAIRQEWTELTDGRNRPIAVMCCLCFPYHKLAEISADWVQLYQAMPPYSRLLQHGVEAPPLTLSLEQGTGAKATALVDRLDYQFLASVAALTLESSVALKSGDLSVRERLEQLGAIASLLPYGCRVDLSVSTWVQSSSMHKIRLGFTDAARPDQKRVLWGKAPLEEMAPSRPARRYYETLIGLQKRHGSSQVVNFLARLRDPLPMQNDMALSALQNLDRPYLISQAVQDGCGSLPEVRALFAQGIPLEPKQRNDLLVYMLDHPSPPSPEDLRIVAQHWQPELWSHLCAAAQSCLDSLDSTPTAQAALEGMMGVAAQQQQLVTFLEVILDHTATLESITAVQAAIRLYNLGLSRLSNKDGLLLLRRHPLFLYEFIAQKMRDLPHAENLPKLFEWLESDGAATRTVKAFRIASGLAAEPAMPEMIAQVSGVGPNHPYLRVLVKTAISKGSAVFECLLPALLVWAMEHRDEVADAEQWEWRTALANATQLTLAPHLQAQADLLVMVLVSDATPPFLPRLIEASRDPAKGQMASYAEELVRHQRPLGKHWGELLNRLVTITEQGMISRPCVLNALELLDRLVESTPPQDVNARIYAVVLGKLKSYSIFLEPEFREREPSVNSWANRLLSSKYAQELRTLILECKFTATLLEEDIAEQVARELSGPRPPALDDLLLTLSRKPQLQDAAGLARFCNQLRLRLQQEERLANRGNEIERRFLGAILEQQFGTSASKEYPHVLLKNLLAEADRIAALLPLIRERLTPDERRQLLTELRKAQEEGNKKR